MVGIVALFFLFQEWQLIRLNSRWRAIEPQSALQLEAATTQIQKYQPWFDRSFRTMRIMKAITEAFPEEGYFATAKSVEIRDLGAVTCRGTARDSAAYIALFDKLRALPEVSDLKTEMERGSSPVQFTLNFNWQEGGGPSGN